MSRGRHGHDDHLVDAIADGAAVPDHDRVAVMLAAWRDDVRAGVPVKPAGRPGATTLALRPAATAAGDGATVVPISAARRRPARLTRFILTAAAGFVMMAGIIVAAGNAGPGSPLWPITRLVYQDRAHSRADQAAAERALAQARRALTDRRYTDAARLMGEADTLINRIHDQHAARRLGAELAELRQLLSAATATADPRPDASPVPSAGTAARGGVPTPAGVTGPTGTGDPPGPPTQSLPGLPVPSLPPPSVPVPTIPLPTLR